MDPSTYVPVNPDLKLPHLEVVDAYFPPKQQQIIPTKIAQLFKNPNQQLIGQIMNQMRFMEFKATSIARSGQLYENDLGIDFQSDSQKDSINTIVKKVLFYMQPGYIIDSHSILPYIPNDCKLKMLIALHNLQYNYIIQLAALCDNKFVQMTETQLLSQDSRSVVITIHDTYFKKDFPQLYLLFVKIDKQSSKQLQLAVHQLSLFEENNNCSPIDYHFQGENDPFTITIKTLQQLYLFDENIITPYNGFYLKNFKSNSCLSNQPQYYLEVMKQTSYDTQYDDVFRCCFLNYGIINIENRSLKLFKETGINNLLRCDFQPILLSYFDYFETQNAFDILTGETVDQLNSKIQLQRPLYNEDSKALAMQLINQNVMYNIFAQDLIIQNCLQVTIPTGQPIKELRDRINSYQNMNLQQPRQFQRTIKSNMFYLRFFDCQNKIQLQIYADDSLKQSVKCIIPQTYQSVVLDENDIYNVKYELEDQQLGFLSVNEFKIEIPIELVQKNDLNAVVTILGENNNVINQGFIKLTKINSVVQGGSPQFISETFHDIPLFQILSEGYFNMSNSFTSTTIKMQLELDSLFFTSTDLLNQFFNFIQVAVSKCQQIRPLLNNEKISEKEKFDAIQKLFSNFRLENLILITRNIFNQSIESKCRVEFFQNYHLIIYQLLDLLTYLSDIDDNSDGLSYNIYFNEYSKKKLETFERTEFVISSDEENNTPFCNTYTPQEFKQRRSISQKYRNQPFRRIIFGTLLLIFINIQKDSQQVQQNIGQHYKIEMFKNQKTHIKFLCDKLRTRGKQQFFGTVDSSLLFNQYVCFGMSSNQNIEVIDAESTLIFENFIRPSPVLLEIFVKGITKSINRNTKFVETASPFLKILQSIIIRNNFSKQNTKDSLLQSLFNFFDILGKQLSYIIIDEQESNNETLLIQLPPEQITNIQTISRQSAQILIDFLEIFDKTTVIQLITSFLSSFLNGKNPQIILSLQTLLQVNNLILERRQEIIYQYSLVIVPFLQQICTNPLVIYYEQVNKPNQILNLILDCVQFTMKIFDTKLIVELSQLVNTLILQFAQIKAKFSNQSLQQLFQILFQNIKAIIQNADDIDTIIWQRVQRNYVSCLFYIWSQNVDQFTPIIKAEPSNLLELLTIATSIFDSVVLKNSAQVLEQNCPFYDMLNVQPSDIDRIIINGKNLNEKTLFKKCLIQIIEQGLITSKTLHYNLDQIIRKEDINYIKDYSNKLMFNAYRLLLFWFDIILQSVTNFSGEQKSTIFSMLLVMSQQDFQPFKNFFIQFVIDKNKLLQLILLPSQIISIIYDSIINSSKPQLNDIFLNKLKQCLNYKEVNFSIIIKNNVLIQKFSDILNKFAQQETEVKPVTDKIIDFISNIPMDPSIIYYSDAAGNQYREDDIYYELTFKQFQKTKDLNILKQLANDLSRGGRFAEAANCFLLLFALQYEKFDSLTNVKYFRQILIEVQKYNFQKLKSEDLLGCLDNCYANYYQTNYLHLAHYVLAWYLELEKPLHCLNEQKRLLLIQKFKDLKQILQNENEASNRMFGYYYKIAFHGKEFSSLDKQIFVQHEPPGTRTNNLQQKIYDFYSKKLTKPLKFEYKSYIDRSTLDLENQNTIQLGTFSEFVENSELERMTDSNCALTTLLLQEVKQNVDTNFIITPKLTPFEEHLNATIFYTSGPLFLNPKEKEKAEFVGRILRFCFLSTPTPGFYTRTIVKHQLEVEWQPIVHNTELIKEQYKMLKSRCQLINSSVISELQMVIQGSVMVQVNAGPLYLAQKFLQFKNKQPNPQFIPSSSIEQANLKKVLELFIRQAGELIKLANRKLENDFRAFQNALVDAFIDLVNKLSKYLDIDVGSLSRMVRL